VQRYALFFIHPNKVERFNIPYEVSAPQDGWRLCCVVVFREGGRRCGTADRKYWSSDRKNYHSFCFSCQRTCFRALASSPSGVSAQKNCELWIFSQSSGAYLKDNH